MPLKVEYPNQLVMLEILEKCHKNLSFVTA